VASEQPRELVSANACGAQDARKRPALYRATPVNGHRNRIGNVWMPQDVVASADPLDVPALLFEGGNNLLAADRRKLGAHAAWTATLLRWTVGMGRPSSCITSR